MTEDTTADQHRKMDDADDQQKTTNDSNDQTRTTDSTNDQQKPIEIEENNEPTQTDSKLLQFLKDKITWENIHYIFCETRKDSRLFWFSYILTLIILFITLMVALLLKPSVTINYTGWYNDNCSTDVITTAPILECDRSLRLYCSTKTLKCACLQNMYWNGSFCDCSLGMYYNGIDCQERLTFGQVCNPQYNLCMEYLTCSSNTNTCDCPPNSYYNQTTCNAQLAFNSTIPCSLNSQCVSGLICSSSVCTCLPSQAWNGYGCTNLSTNGEYCVTNSQCDSSTFLICNGTYSRCTCNLNSYWDGRMCRSRLTNGSLCNNTQQCYSSLICYNNYCQCPLSNTYYWSSQTLTCQPCFGKDLFLFDGICYNVPVPQNTTYGTYSTLASSYILTTIQYDYQLMYVFGHHIRVYNGVPIFLAVSNPIRNYFQWSPDNTIIKPTYFCNETLRSNYTGYVVSFKLEINTPCLRALSNVTIGQLARQINTYSYHMK